MNYLMIQNKGEAPVESYTLLGASASRGKGLIGQFGTGNKHAINMLLRLKLPFRVYSGKTRVNFETSESSFRDTTVHKVQYQVNRGAFRDTGWTLEFGELDWNQVSMALREFVSNALDETSDFKSSLEDEELSIKIVHEKEVRARSGYTRVFIQANQDVQQYFGELPKRFLHFSDHSEDLSKTLLPKRGRSLDKSEKPMIYRCGVFVRQLRETEGDSLYDYNFNSTEITIDDCRNSSEYSLRAACARAIKNSTTKELAQVLKKVTQHSMTFESKLDPYYLSPNYNDNSEQLEAKFKAAWETVGGIPCESSAPIVDYISRKGHEPTVVNSKTWVDVLGKHGVKTVTSLLTKGQKETLLPTSEASSAVDTVWGWLENMNKTTGKAKPEVKCFRDITDAESDTMGYFSEDTVYFREDLAGKYLLKVAVEECAHYVTGSLDRSRDIQNYLIDIIVEALK